ncbi:MAG: HAMP domain-containing histidine kinase [Clostridiales bacterium]|nr:HAMP domain-containing histidine kinase [Clostridiales bacterium]
MKKARFSVKTKMTVWYMGLALLVTAAMAWGLFSAVSRAGRKYLEDILVAAMTDASDHVAYQTGIPRLDMTDAEDFDRVHFALLDEEGSLWQGRWPLFELAYEDGSVRQIVGSQGRQFLVQDFYLPFSEGNLWLRGYLSLDTMMFLQHATADGWLLLLPGLLVLAGVGGYFLTRRAFRPVDQMARQAESILDGKDLARRMTVRNPDRPDEFGQLGLSFNEMMARLEESFRREKQFTDDASHELRTPLAVIAAASEYALSMEDESEYRQALEVIGKKAGEMQEIATQLLQLARMEGGRASMEQENVDLSALCCQVALEMAEQKGKMVDTDEVQPGITVTGDELMLMRAVINLTDNALKFGNTGATITLECQNGMAVLRVEDDGNGIGPEHVDRIFDRFYQAETHRSAQRPGAGLGLPMARQIVRMHGGELHLESTGKAGTVMRMEIPLKN